MITAIVPARSGSKRLPGKNIKLLAGRPLVFHTLDAVIDHDLISEVLFTTDSEEYAQLVFEEYGNKVRSIIRPPDYASDTTKVYEELKRLYEAGEIKTEWYMQCLPTCPLRNHSVVNGMLAEWGGIQEPIFSGMAYDFPIQFAFGLDKEMEWSPIFDDSPMITGNTRSQDIPKTYRPNGAMYLQHVKNLTNKTLYKNARVYLMSAQQSVDVDTELDFKFCEMIIEDNNNG